MTLNQCPQVQTFRWTLKWSTIPFFFFFFNPCLHSISLALLKPVWHCLIPCAALGTHTKWPWKAPGWYDSMILWYFHLWALLQMRAWDPSQGALPRWVPVTAARGGGRAVHHLLAPRWPPSPTFSSRSRRGLAHSGTPMLQPPFLLLRAVWGCLSIDTPCKPGMWSRR